MELFIPTWILWTLGIVIGVPLVLFLGFCCWIGFIFVKDFKLNW